MYNRKLNITNSEKTNILEMYEPTKSYFFDNYLTIDGRYYIQNDYVFDLHEQKELGDLFSLENLKTIFETVNVKNSIIVENIKKLLYNTTNEILMLYEVKREILLKRSLLTEQDSEGDEYEDSTLNEPQHGTIAGGVLYLARKLKSMLWSIGGMAVDALLVASGIGKTVQWIPWAILLTLDTYQWTSGDYGSDTEFKEASKFWKYLTLGFDAIGMMSAGPIAKAAAKLFEPVKLFKSEGQIAQWVSKSPQAKAVLTKMSSIISGAGSWLTKGADMMMSKMPTLGKWMSSIATTAGNLLKTVGSFIGKILSSPGKLAQNIGTKLGGENIGRGFKAATNTAAMVGGLQVGANQYAQHKTGLNAIQLKNAETMDNVFAKYGDKDPFDN